MIRLLVLYFITLPSLQLLVCMLEELIMRKRTVL